MAYWHFTIHHNAELLMCYYFKRKLCNTLISLSKATSPNLKSPLIQSMATKLSKELSKDLIKHVVEHRQHSC